MIKLLLFPKEYAFDLSNYKNSTLLNFSDGYSFQNNNIFNLSDDYSFQKSTLFNLSDDYYFQKNTIFNKQQSQRRQIPQVFLPFGTISAAPSGRRRRIIDPSPFFTGGPSVARREDIGAVTLQYWSPSTVLFPL